MHTNKDSVTDKDADLRSRLLGQVSETVLAEEVMGKGRKLGKEQNRARQKKGQYR